MSDKLYEHEKYVHELKVRAAERAHDNLDQQSAKLNEATIAAGTVALRTAVLINGAAAIALLAFVGGLLSSANYPSNQVNQVASGIESFVWGVAFATGAMAAVYFTNYCHAGVSHSYKKNWEPPFIEDGEETSFWERFKGFWQFIAIAAGLASLVFFVLGMNDIRRSIKQLKANPPIADSVRS